MVERMVMLDDRIVEALVERDDHHPASHLAEVLIAADSVTQKKNLKELTKIRGQCYDQIIPPFFPILETHWRFS
jgi:hypothetical protein